MTMWHRLLHRLTDRGRSERLDALEQLVRKAVDADREHAAALRDVAKTIARQPTAKDLREIRQSLRGLAARLAAHEDPLFGRSRIHLLGALERMAADHKPVLVGPWTGEVGYELLYWIPFVRWALAHMSLPPERVLTVSRGGVASWYGVPEDQYADVFSAIPVDEFRATTARQPSLKQRQAGPLDDRIIAAVTRQRGLEDVNVLHPGMMFKAFRHYWDGTAGHTRYDEFAQPSLLTPAAGDRPAALPAEYVAVRFYFRRSFPDTPANRSFAESAIAALAERMPVVDLTFGHQVDDHHAWAPRGRHGVTVVDVTDLTRNLAIQSAVIAGARAFVGTYGGYSYLAPLYGVPAVAFHSRHAFEGIHLMTAMRMFESLDAAPLTAIDISQVAVLQSVLLDQLNRPV